MGSARVPRAANGVPPLASSSCPSVTVWWFRQAEASLRRDAANHTPQACAPQHQPHKYSLGQNPRSGGIESPIPRHGLSRGFIMPLVCFAPTAIYGRPKLSLAEALHGAGILAKPPLQPAVTGGAGRTRKGAWCGSQVEVELAFGWDRDEPRPTSWAAGERASSCPAANTILLYVSSLSRAYKDWPRVDSLRADPFSWTPASGHLATLARASMTALGEPKVAPIGRGALRI